VGANPALCIFRSLTSSSGKNNTPTPVIKYLGAKDGFNSGGYDSRARTKLLKSSVDTFALETVCTPTQKYQLTIMMVLWKISDTGLGVPAYTQILYL
jgi:hypothetical protein